jgi:hypothetical protein
VSTKCHCDILQQWQNLSSSIIAKSYNGVQRCDFSRLKIALKQGLLNGFERKDLRYHVHACPEAVYSTTDDTARLSQPRQRHVSSVRDGRRGQFSIFGRPSKVNKTLATELVILPSCFGNPFWGFLSGGLIRIHVKAETSF